MTSLWIVSFSLVLQAGNSWSEIFPDLAQRYNIAQQPNIELDQEEGKSPTESHQTGNSKLGASGISSDAAALAHCLKIKRIPEFRAPDPLDAATASWIRRNGGVSGFYERFKTELRAVPQIRVQVQDARMHIHDPITVREVEEWKKSGALSDLGSEQIEELEFLANPFGRISRFVVESRRWPKQDAQGVEKLMAVYSGNFGGHGKIYRRLTKTARAVLLELGFDQTKKRPRLPGSQVAEQACADGIKDITPQNTPPQAP